MEKDWREAKPKWAVEAAEKEIAGMKRRLALRWPDEARPTPVAFSWRDYDRLEGTPEPGEYFFHSSGGYVHALQIRAKDEGDAGWKGWRFCCRSMWGDKWTDTVVRGPLYTTEYEARLAALWGACDRAAADLERAWAHVLRERGFV